MNETEKAVNDISKPVGIGFASFIILLAFVVAISMLLAFPVMYLINYLFSEQLLMFVFGVAKITFWKTFFFNMFLGLVRGNVNTKTKN